MIIGIGTDIIEIQRIEKVIQKTPRFYKTVFTQEERAYYEAGHKKVESLAGAFAAKEAVSKALGTGFREFSPCDIEVVRNELGRPGVRLLGGAQEIAQQLGIKQIHLSISHCQTYAVAYVIIEGEV